MSPPGTDKPSDHPPDKPDFTPWTWGVKNKIWGYNNLVKHKSHSDVSNQSACAKIAQEASASTTADDRPAYGNYDSNTKKCYIYFPDPHDWENAIKTHCVIEKAGWYPVYKRGKGPHAKLDGSPIVCPNFDGIGICRTDDAINPNIPCPDALRMQPLPSLAQKQQSVSAADCAHFCFDQKAGTFLSYDEEVDDNCKCYLHYDPYSDVVPLSCQAEGMPLPALIMFKNMKLNANMPIPPTCPQAMVQNGVYRCGSKASPLGPYDGSDCVAKSNFCAINVNPNQWCLDHIGDDAPGGAKSGCKKNCTDWKSCDQKPC